MLPSHQILILAVTCITSFFLYTLGLGRVSVAVARILVAVIRFAVKMMNFLFGSNPATPVKDKEEAVSGSSAVVAGSGLEVALSAPPKMKSLGSRRKKGGKKEKKIKPYQISLLVFRNKFEEEKKHYMEQASAIWNRETLKIKNSMIEYGLKQHGLLLDAIKNETDSTIDVGERLNEMKRLCKTSVIDWEGYVDLTTPFSVDVAEEKMVQATYELRPDIIEKERKKRENKQKRSKKYYQSNKTLAQKAQEYEEKLDKQLAKQEKQEAEKTQLEAEKTQLEVEKSALQNSIKKIQEKAVSKLHLSAKQAEKLVRVDSTTGSPLESIDLGSGSPPRVKSLFFSASSATTTAENSVAPSQTPFIDTKTPVNRSRRDITGATLNKMKNLILTQDKEKTGEMKEFVEAVSPALSLKVEVGGDTTLKPLITYHGGKSKEILKIVAYFPPGSTWTTYVEPFVGGASIYLWLQPEDAVLNDKDETIMNFYGQSKISGNFMKIGESLMKMECSKDVYDDIKLSLYMFSFFFGGGFYSVFPYFFNFKNIEINLTMKNIMMILNVILGFYI